VEIWQPIIGYEGSYEISNTVKIKSMKYISSGKIIEGDTTRKNERRVVLCKNGNQKRFLIHRLVGVAFILNPDNKPEINHIDGDRSNNHVTNLEWATRSENELHAYRTGLKTPTRNERSGHCRLSCQDVRDIRNMYKPKAVSQQKIADIYKVSREHIRDIINYKERKFVD